ncbi:HD domain-containing protein [Inediibacterium massiliense]|uniref:HD domain-containing protein n=1 Tax=Inediibacterium massiliense TaxID=1658111 RepID=UPI0006B41B77|nr:HD domain-containing protein [Inediibacterium massiliense]
MNTFNNLFFLIKDDQRKILSIIDPQICKENPICLLQAVRLMSQYDLSLDEKTTTFIRENAKEIQKVAGNEIAFEIFEILKEKDTYEYFKMMDEEFNLFEYIFPEILPMKNVGKCDYHVVDAWDHSLYTLKEIEKIIYEKGYFEGYIGKAYEEHIKEILPGGHTRMQLLKLGALFHDIGKPRAKWIDKRGKTRFIGHEVVGTEMMENIANRFQLPLASKKYLCKMVREHMWTLNLYKRNDVSGRATYDLFKKLGEEVLDILLIGLSDVVATRKLLHPDEEMGMYKIHVEYLANSYLTRFKEVQALKDLLTPEDIKTNFKNICREKREMILEALRKEIFFGELPPQRERVLEYIKRCVQKESQREEKLS